MADEQFITSDDMRSSLLIVKELMNEKIRSLCAENNITFSATMHLSFELPENINEFPQAMQQAYVNILHLSECITIIDTKLGEHNG